MVLTNKPGSLKLYRTTLIVTDHFHISATLDMFYVGTEFIWPNKKLPF